MIPLSLSVFAFAYSTVVCWFSYGRECVEYLFGRASRLFAPVFFAFVGLGSHLGSGLLLSVTDVMVLILSALTLSAILKRREKIKELSLFDSSFR